MSESYVRPDGRGRKQLRDIKVEVGILDRAEGSARVDLGKNIAIATVYGPREMHPKHAARSDRAVVRINYRMATFSVDGYKRSYPSRREKEISKVLSEAFESVVLTKNWPRSVIDVHIEIFQSDGGTRTAAAIAITAALADAGIPMRDMLAGIASGLYDDHVVLDMTGHEDMKGTGDMPILYSPSVDEISLFQLDGKFTFDQFKDALFTSMEGIREIVSKIQDALKVKYLRIREEFGVDEEEEDEESLSYDSEEDDENEEEITPVPEEPVGTAHAVAAATEGEEITSSSFEVKTAPVSTSDDEEATSEPVKEPQRVGTITDTEQSENVVEGPTSETQPNEGQETSSEEDEIKNTWFNKPGAELKTMGDDDQDDNESESVIRDLEYMEDE